MNLILGNTIPELDKLRLETSDISSSQFLTLEEVIRLYLKQEVFGDTISRINITPVGGKDATVDPTGEFDANTTITIFNPAIDSEKHHLIR